MWLKNQKITKWIFQFQNQSTVYNEILHTQYIRTSGYTEKQNPHNMNTGGKNKIQDVRINCNGDNEVQTCYHPQFQKSVNTESWKTHIIGKNVSIR